jgi:uncharacterized protein
MQAIQNTITYVKEQLADAEGGHDWWHTERVWKTAKHIAKSEEVDLLVVELGALLHDIADSKFHDGDESIGPRKARAFLHTLEIGENVINHVIRIIENISFKGGKEAQTFQSTELDVVQDADRLDALGAIASDLNMTKEEYKKSNAPSINHFYEKLLLLKDRMNTATGKAVAAKRHQFMESYLKQFYSEWEGKL